MGLFEKLVGKRSPKIERSVANVVPEFQNRVPAPDPKMYQAGLYREGSQTDLLSGRVSHGTSEYVASSEGARLGLTAKDRKAALGNIENPTELKQSGAGEEITASNRGEGIVYSRAAGTAVRGVDEQVKRASVSFSDSQRGQQETGVSSQTEVTESAWLSMTPAEQQSYSVELNREISKLAKDLAGTEEPLRWAELNDLLKQKKAAQESLKTVMLRNSGTSNPQ